MNELGYPPKISILTTEEGEGYLIEFPDLPGCVSDGDTIDEAIANGRDAILCWIETAKEHGDVIPPPKSSLLTSEHIEEGIEEKRILQALTMTTVSIVFVSIAIMMLILAYVKKLTYVQ